MEEKLRILKEITSRLIDKYDQQQKEAELRFFSNALEKKYIDEINQLTPIESEYKVSVETLKTIKDDNNRIDTTKDKVPGYTKEKESVYAQFRRLTTEDRQEKLKELREAGRRKSELEKELQELNAEIEFSPFDSRGKFHTEIRRLGEIYQVTPIFWRLQLVFKIKQKNICF
jgi:hypothetical protein